MLATASTVLQHWSQARTYSPTPLTMEGSSGKCRGNPKKTKTPKPLTEKHMEIIAKTQQKTQKKQRFRQRSGRSLRALLPMDP